MPDRRRLISHHVDEDGAKTLSINTSKWKGVLGFVAAVLSTSGLIAGLVLAMLHPVVTQWIHEETRPAQLEISATLAELQQEVRVGLRGDLVDLRQTAATRAELDARMTRIEIRIDDIYQLLTRGQR